MSRTYQCDRCDTKVETPWKLWGIKTFMRVTHYCEDCKKAIQKFAGVKE